MKKDTVLKNAQAKRRARRTRSVLRAVSDRPRLSVFRSASHISAQIIDDAQGKTLAAAMDKHVKADGQKPVEVARLVGAELAKRAKEAGVVKVHFDRGSYRYHGRVQALAEGARENGLEF